MAQFNLGRVKGDKGDIGKSFRIRGTWATDTEYLNNDTTIDVINHSGCAYACKITHTSSGAGPNATEWGLLLSNKFDIVDTDTINDPSKLPSSAVTFALGQEIDAINNNLAVQNIASAFVPNSNISVAAIEAKKLLNMVFLSGNFTTQSQVDALSVTSVGTISYKPVAPVNVACATGTYSGAQQYIRLQIDEGGQVYILANEAIAIGVQIRFSLLFFAI